LAELSYEPGASVALIARQNDVNANLLFKWRHQYLDGAFGLPSKLNALSTSAPAAAPTLLPVSIVDESPAGPSVPASTPDASPKSTARPDAQDGLCEVDFECARLRVRGHVSPGTLRILISELSRLPPQPR
jgi:transposase